MLYYIYMFCLLYGFWDGYKKLTNNKSLIKETNETYTGLLDFIICNNK